MGRARRCTSRTTGHLDDIGRALSRTPFRTALLSDATVECTFKVAQSRLLCTDARWGWQVVFRKHVRVSKLGAQQLGTRLAPLVVVVVVVVIVLHEVDLVP